MVLSALGLFGAFGVLVGASSAHAEPTEAATPRFHIESLAIENAVHFSPEILIAASRLEEDASYTERELRSAADRIAQLPLILDVEVVLAKGSHRGRYVVVFRVREARRWFFGVDSVLTRWNREVSIDGLTTSDWVEGGAAFVGRRFSLGRRGILYLVASGADGLFTLGYTQHDLFGRGVRFDGSLAVSDCQGVSDRTDTNEAGDEGCETRVLDLGLDPTFSSWSSTGEGARLRFSLTAPLRGQQSIFLRGSARSSATGIRRRAYTPQSTTLARFDDQRHQELSLGWAFDSQDDPLFPRRGSRLEVAIDFERLQAELGPSDGTASTVRWELDSEQFGIHALARQDWPLTERQTFWLSGRARLGQSDLHQLPTPEGDRLEGRSDRWQLRGSAGHSMLLHRRGGKGPHRELYWTSDLHLFTGGASPDFGQPENPLQGLELSTGLAYRTSWGVFKLRLAYFDGAGR